MSTAVVERPAPEIGSTTPRVFTPPLAENCTGPAADQDGQVLECPCGCGLNPNTSWGFDCNYFANNVLHKALGDKFPQLLPWQEWLNIHALEKSAEGGFRFKIVVVLVARQNGKCVLTCEDVLTTDGWKRMGDLAVGDQVFHPDGRPINVTEAHDPFVASCYQIETTDGRKLTVDGEHQWTVKDVRRYTRKGRRGEKRVRTYQWETISTTDLMARGLIRGVRKPRANGRPHIEYAFRLPSQERIVSKPVDLPVDPYLLGAWLGDGFTGQRKICAGRQDLAEMTQLLTQAGARIDKVEPIHTAFSIQFDVSDRMVDGFGARLRDLGIWKAKAIPDLYLTAGTEQRQALLAGLLDTDGSCSRAGQVEFCNTNERLADGVLYLARSLGYRATKVAHRATLNGEDRGPKYRVCFTPTDYPFRLARKNARVKLFDVYDRSAISIKSITKVADAEVRCIRVDRDDGLFLAGRDLIPTHNTLWLKQLGLWRLFVSKYGVADRAAPGARLAIIAAQNLDYAEQVLKDVVDVIRDHPRLSRELINHRVTNGKHRAILSNRRYWRAVTASRKGGRSLAVDLAMLDELREHTTTDAWDAIAPATTVRRFSQIICTSNAGDQRSEVLRAQRDAALRRITTGETENTKTGFFEWSVPTEVNPRDEAYWHMANPALGRLNDFCLADLRAMFEAAQYRNLPGFMTEHLCMWVDALEPGIIPAEHWQETIDQTSRRAETSPVYAAVDINYERTRSFVAIAARRADGDLHIEVIQAARGTDWVVDYLKARQTKFAGVAVQENGAPASMLIDDLKAAFIPVVEWGPGAEVAGGCGRFFDEICGHTLWHRPAPVLDRAAASGIGRRVVDGWVLDRRNSPVDVAPLMACAAAVWLEHRGNPTPEIYVWPDEDTLAAWETEAAEQYGDLPPSPRTLDDIEGTSWWTT